MDIKNIFKRGKKISKFDFRKNYVKSKTTQGFFENEKISQIFDRRAEKDELNQALYEKSKGGLTKTEMKEVIGGLKTLTERERYEFAKAVFPSAPSGKRFIRPSKNTNQNNPSKSATYGTFRSSSKSAEYKTAKPNSVPAATTSTSNTQMTPMKMAMILNRARDISANLPGSENDSDSTKKREGGFLGALDAVARNKHN